LKAVHPYWVTAAQTMLEAEALLRDRQDTRQQKT